jgi:hypothetical protein
VPESYLPTPALILYAADKEKIAYQQGLVRTCNSSTHSHTKPHYIRPGINNPKHNIYTHAENEVNWIYTY